MYLLPLLDAHLLPCAKHWRELLPQPSGRYCASCEQVVQDFSAAADPAAALAAARAAAPAGQVCGRFAATQVAQPRLRPRLRRFVVALVLVVGLGLSAQEALAQVQQAATKAEQPELVHRQTSSDKAVNVRHVAIERYHAEQMPTFRGAGYQAIIDYVQQQLVWPKNAGLVCVEGRIFIRFTVEKDGSLHNVRVVKGLHPLLDAEAVRAVKKLNRMQPGRDHGKLVAVTMTVPISFDRK